MKACIMLLALAASQFLICSGSLAALYYGNEYGGASAGAVSGGILSLTDNGNSVSGTFTRGNGSFANNLVIYIDSVPGVGFGNTTSFYDSTAGLRASISGFNGSSRSTFQFANGFGADYAISMGVGDYPGGAVFQLVGGSGNQFEWIASVGLAPSSDPNGGPYTFSFNWSDINLTPGSGSGFRFETGYVYGTGNSYYQSFERITGASGWGNTITFTEAHEFLQAVPEPTNIALAIFGGIVATGAMVSRVRKHLAQRRSKRA